MKELPPLIPSPYLLLLFKKSFDAIDTVEELGLNETVKGRKYLAKIILGLWCQVRGYWSAPVTGGRCQVSQSRKGKGKM